MGLCACAHPRCRHSPLIDKKLLLRDGFDGDLRICVEQTRQLSRAVSSEGGAGRGLTRFSVHRSVHLPSDPGTQQFAHVINIADLERVARERENLTAQRPKGHGRPGYSSGLSATQGSHLAVAAAAELLRQSLVGGAQLNLCCLRQARNPGLPLLDATARTAPARVSAERAGARARRPEDSPAGSQRHRFFAQHQHEVEIGPATRERPVNASRDGLERGGCGAHS